MTGWRTDVAVVVARGLPAVAATLALYSTANLAAQLTTGDASWLTLAAIYVTVSTTIATHRANRLHLDDDGPHR